MNSWFKLPTLETNSQQFTSQTWEHTLKLCEAFETLHTKCEPKRFWKGGSNFSPVWAVPARQRPAAIHTVDFNGFWIRPLYPFQNEFWSLNWNIQLWAALAQDKASLHKSCVFGLYGIHGQVTAQIHRYERDSSMANGIHGSQHQQGLSCWFSLLLEVRIQTASPLQARGLLPPSALQRDDFLKAALQEFTMPPAQSTARHKAQGRLSYGAINLPWLAGEQLWDELSSALLKRRVIYMWCVSARCLSWTDNSILALLHVYKEESSNQPCDKGMMKVWRVCWYLCCAYRCLV